MKPAASTLTLLLALACAREPATPTGPATKSAPPAAAVPEQCRNGSLPQSGLRTAVVAVDGIDGEVRIDIEIAETDRQRMIGMMCRTAMGPLEGMLFIFPDERPRSFWMKNTLLPLDMVFLDRDGRVVGVVERAEPLTLDARSVNEPAMYVLELLGGTAASHGFAKGQFVRFDGVKPTTDGK